MSVEVVIPTKSFIDGIHHLLPILDNDPEVTKITVVADGDEAFERVKHFANDLVIVTKVPLGAGIHVMWNLALNSAEPGNYVLLINDDVHINHRTVSGMVDTLKTHPELGIVCPNYDGRHIDGPYVEVVMTCGGNYEGGGGLGGFCMMLASDLVPLWRFDERMKWWYGDDDVLMWTRKTMNRVAAICAASTCANNCSWTISNDPPHNFLALIENDAKLFTEKWG